MQRDIDRCRMACLDQMEYLKRYDYGYARMIDAGVSEAPLFLGHIVTFTSKLSLPIRANVRRFAMLQRFRR